MKLENSTIDDGAMAPFGHYRTFFNAGGEAIETVYEVYDIPPAPAPMVPKVPPEFDDGKQPVMEAAWIRYEDKPVSVNVAELLAAVSGKTRSL